MYASEQTSRPHLVLLAAGALVLLGCASGSHAAEGAGRGATTGVVSGAVGGLVGALVFGGNPAESAARGAVVGGAAGATAGAIAGGQVDKQERAQREAELERLRQQIGDAAFGGLEALVDCRHEACMNRAAEAQRDPDPNHALAGRWLELLCQAEQGRDDEVQALLPGLVEADWNLESEAQAQEKLRVALTRLAEIRAEYGKPQACRG